MNIPTQEQIDKLPKWAQEYVKDLDRRAVIAENALKEYTDTSTPSPFWIEDFLCIGKGTPQYVKRYVQTYKFVVEHEGIRADIMIRDKDPGIEITYSDCNRGTSEVGLVPLSFQRLKLIPKDKMR